MYCDPERRYALPWAFEYKPFVVKGLMAYIKHHTPQTQKMCSTTRVLPEVRMHMMKHFLGPRIHPRSLACGAICWFGGGFRGGLTNAKLLPVLSHQHVLLVRRWLEFDVIGLAVHRPCKHLRATFLNVNDHYPLAHCDLHTAVHLSEIRPSVNNLDKTVIFPPPSGRDLANADTISLFTPTPSLLPRIFNSCPQTGEHIPESNTHTATPVTTAILTFTIALNFVFMDGVLPYSIIGSWPSFPWSS